MAQNRDEVKTLRKNFYILIFDIKPSNNGIEWLRPGEKWTSKEIKSINNGFRQ